MATPNTQHFSPPLHCVNPAGDKCGEGLVYSADESALYWTDINRFLIHRHDLLTGNSKTWLFEEPIVALSLSTTSGKMLVASASKIFWWWPSDGRVQDYGVHLPTFPTVRFNDGRCDPRGEFWVGSMKNNVLANGDLGEVGRGLGELWHIKPKMDASERVTCWRKNLGISNTLCWNKERTAFYFGDTLENVIWRYDYDARTGAIANEKPFFSGFERGSPDGSAIDNEGFLWNCRYGGACIVRVAPNGTVDKILEMPVLNITTCAFGGKDLSTLFITTAGSTRSGDRLAGSLFSTQPGAVGLPENLVRDLST